MLTTTEQYQLELLNRSRLDPLGEVMRNAEVQFLNEGVASYSDPISDRPKQPLAPSAQLTEAATGHSAWMLEADTFSHIGQGGSSVRNRAEAAGYDLQYPGFIGENISWSGVRPGPVRLEDTIHPQHSGLFASPGHRVNILRDAFREIGISQLKGDFTQNGITWSASMLTNKFGLAGYDIFLTGVAYDDADGDGFYSMGEGVAGVAFSVGGATAPTMTAGGYALKLQPVDEIAVTVTFDGRTIAAILATRTANLPYGAGTVELVENVKLDLLGGVRLLSSADMVLGAGASEAGLLGVADLALTANDAGNMLIGNAGDNLLIGGAGDDTLMGGAGNDTLDGGGGRNTAVFSGNQADYAITQLGDVVTVTDSRGIDGTDTLRNIQVLSFADGKVILTPDPPLTAGDVAAAALDGGPEVAGDVLVNDSGTGLHVVAVNGVETGGPLAGALGTLTLLADGRFAYTADAARHLPEGATDTDVFSYTVRDAAGNSATAMLAITVTGVNDPASISGVAGGTVVAGDPDRQRAEGSLVVTDPDTGEDRFEAPDAAALQGAFGSFAFDADTGSWSFTVADVIANAPGLTPGEEVVESLTVASIDGTANKTITVKVIAPVPGEAATSDLVALTGRVTDLAGNELPGTTVTFSPASGANASMQTDASGSFFFKLPIGSSGQIDAVRDIGAGDPAITTASALEALRMAVGLAPSWGDATAHHYIAADLDGDGQVTTADGLGILRAALGLTVEHAPRWLFLDSEADLAQINRSNAQAEFSLHLDPIAVDTPDLVLLGLLVGYVHDHH